MSKLGVILLSVLILLNCRVIPRDCEMIKLVVSQILFIENGNHLKIVSDKGIPIHVESTMNMTNWEFGKYQDKHKLILIEKTKDRALSLIDSIPPLSFVSRDTFGFKESGKVEYNYYQISPLFKRGKDFYIMSFYISSLDQSLNLYSFKVDKNCEITNWKSIDSYHRFSK